MNKTEKLLKKKFDLLPQGNFEVREPTFTSAKKSPRMFIRFAEAAVCLCFICGLIFGISYLKNQDVNRNLKLTENVAQTYTVENVGVSDDFKLYKVPIAADITGVKNIIRERDTGKYYTLSKGEVTPFDVIELTAECEVGENVYSFEFSYGTLDGERVLIPPYDNETWRFQNYDDENIWVITRNYNEDVLYAPPFLYNINTGKTTDIIGEIMPGDFKLEATQFSDDGKYIILITDDKFYYVDVENKTFRDIGEMTGIKNIHYASLPSGTSFGVSTSNNLSQTLYTYNVITGELKKIYSGSNMLSVMGNANSDEMPVGITLKLNVSASALFKNGDKYKIDGLKDYAGLWFYSQGDATKMIARKTNGSTKFVSVNQFALIDFETLQTKLIPRDDFEITGVDKDLAAEGDEELVIPVQMPQKYAWLNENEFAVSQENADVIYVYDFSDDNSEELFVTTNVPETTDLTTTETEN